MAHYVFADRARRRGLPAVTLSMGTLGLAMHRAADEAIAACAEVDVDLTPHRSQGLSLGVLRAATHVFIMEEQHRAAIARLDPELARRTIMLGAWDPEGGGETIDDPVNQPITAFRQCLGRLERAIDRFLDAQQQVPR